MSFVGLAVGTGLGAAAGSAGLLGLGSAAAGAVAGGTLGLTAGSAYNADRSARKAVTQQREAGQQGIDVLRESDDYRREVDERNRRLLGRYAAGEVPSLELQRTIAGVPGYEQRQADYFDNFQFSPYADFVRREGLQSIDQASMATGTLIGGSRMKEIQKFISGLASGEVNNRFNQAAQITQQQLGADLGQAGMAAPALGGGQAQLYASTGLSNAAGTLGRGQILGDSLGDLLHLTGGMFGSGVGANALPSLPPGGFFQSPPQIGMPSAAAPGAWNPAAPAGGTIRLPSQINPNPQFGINIPIPR